MTLGFGLNPAAGIAAIFTRNASRLLPDPVAGKQPFAEMPVIAGQVGGRAAATPPGRSPLGRSHEKRNLIVSDHGRVTALPS